MGEGRGEQVWRWGWADEWLRWEWGKEGKRKMGGRGEG